ISDRSCAGGAFCAGTCITGPAAGEACHATLPCASSLNVCVPPLQACVPRVAVGQPCPTGYECLGLGACDTATHTCVAKSGPGQACDTTPCLGDLACTSSGCTLLPAPAPPTCQ